jgi:hypothetical protein
VNLFIKKCSEQYILMIKPDPKIKMLSDIVRKVINNKSIDYNKILCLYNPELLSYRIFI